MTSTFKSYNLHIESLGFNYFHQDLKDHTQRSFVKWDRIYKGYLRASTESVILIDQFSQGYNFKKFDQYLSHFTKSGALFLLVSLDRDYFFCNTVYKYLQEKIYSYFIYDWIFGALSNFKRIYTTYIERPELAHFPERPEVALILQTGEWTSEILNELNTRFVFTLGLSDLKHITYIDFPLPLMQSFEAAFFSLRLLLIKFKRAVSFIGYAYLKKLLKLCGENSGVQ